VDLLKRKPLSARCLLSFLKWSLMLCEMNPLKYHCLVQQSVKMGFMVIASEYVVRLMGMMFLRDRNVKGYFHYLSYFA